MQVSLYRRDLLPQAGRALQLWNRNGLTSLGAPVAPPSCFRRPVGCAGGCVPLESKFQDCDFMCYKRVTEGLQKGETHKKKLRSCFWMASLGYGAATPPHWHLHSCGDDPIEVFRTERKAKQQVA